MNSNYSCAVPLIQAFVTNSGNFRNCCATKPQLESDPDTEFNAWWTGEKMSKFRNSLKSDKLPHACKVCEIKEDINGRSLRTVINDTVDMNNLDIDVPSRWHIMFGNVCNLACWICGPKFSSVIENHYSKVGMIQKDFISPQESFNKRWPSLKNEILKSYDHHEVISITLGGGEPLYNKDVYDFLLLLKDRDLANRTKLEFNTNATQYNLKLAQILEDVRWRSICMYLSLDTIGNKAEWLRYGCKWEIIDKNIFYFKNIADYIEVHSAISVLNIMDLPVLKDYCDSIELEMRINPIVSPNFMALIHWDHDPNDLVARQTLEKYGFQEFYDLIGKNPIPGSKEKLKNYIMKFDGIRNHLRLYDEPLSKLLGLF